MSTTTTEPETVRTYGAWRVARDIGFWGMGPVASMVVLGCVLFTVLVMAVSVAAGLMVAVPAGVAIGLTVSRWNGMPFSMYVLQRLRWWWGSLRGYQSYSAVELLEHPQAWALPGALAPTRLVTVSDRAGVDAPFALVWDTRSGLLTSTLVCSATSTWLVDVDQADKWVGRWHDWLANLGYDKRVAWVAVTVDSAPEPGSTLAHNISQHLDEAAPRDTLTMVRELQRRSPATAADVETRVSITFDPARAATPARSLAEQCDEVRLALDGLAASLGSCGVTVERAASASMLAGRVRTAFEPTSRGEVNRLLTSAWSGPGEAGEAGEDDALLTWADARPWTAKEEWGLYRHDSGISVSWMWDEAPRQQVTSTILSRLASPGQWPRRFTMLYRPMDSASAAAMLERQVNAAAFREGIRKARKLDPSQREVQDRQQAYQAAMEEARGAGVVRMTLLVTVTVEDEAQLRAAVADTESRAEQCKIRLRRLWGAQAAGFMSTLPCGLHPKHLAQRGMKG